MHGVILLASFVEAGELRCLEVKLPTKFNTDGRMIYGMPDNTL